MIVEPKVTLLASTCIEVNKDDWDSDALSEWMVTYPDVTAAEHLIEFAGRACYQSFHRPNPATADIGNYLRRTLFEQGHWSIAEHASATFYITGVSRALTHELIRHRHLSYSQLSQRYVNEEDANIVAPPALRDDVEARDYLDDVAEFTNEAYAVLADSLMEDLEKAGLSKRDARKQAREAARAVLPNMTETRIVVTGNLRAWDEFTKRRTAPDADREIQEVAGMIRDELHEVAPNIFPKADV